MRALLTNWLLYRPNRDLLSIVSLPGARTGDSGNGARRFRMGQTEDLSIVRVSSKHNANPRHANVG